MPRLPVALLLAAVILARPGARLCGQAAPTAYLWHVAATTLPVPPALASGAAGVFWNPAQSADDPGHVTVYVDLIHTPPEVGVTGVLAGVSTAAGALGRLSLGFARVAVTDLIRTSTNPARREGSVEVYAQVIGVGWSRHLGAARLGTAVRLHTDRLDDLTTSGWTADIGLGYDPASRVRFTAATQFAHPRDGDRQTRLYAAAEAVGWRGALWDVPAALSFRVGTATARDEGTDLIIGIGFALGGRVTVDLATANEASRGERDWRGKVGLSAQVGRYRVSVARATGVGGLGAAYRVGIEMAVR